jgi:hypothetical protein
MSEIEADSRTNLNDGEVAMKTEKRSSSKVGLPLIAFTAAIVIVGVAPTAAATTYTFEELPLNEMLNGNDGWISDPSLGELVTQQDDSPVNGTQVIQPLATVGSEFLFIALSTRVNDSSFRYSPFFGMESSAVLEFDATARAVAGIALGRDADGDGILSLGLGERGPAFGTFREFESGVPNFMIQTTTGAYLAPLTTGQRADNLETDWYRLRLRMDLTANGGAGAGSLSYMNLTLGDTEYRPVSELQNINLSLDEMLPSASPEFWDSIFLVMRFDGRQHMPSLDNVVPRVPVVLQQDRTIHVQALDALPFGAKYDLELTPVSVPEDPSGLYWGLAQYRWADPSTPSASSMLPNWDLLLEQVDVVDALPETDTVSDVSLLFAGWDGDDPHSMIWRLGAFLVP